MAEATYFGYKQYVQAWIHKKKNNSDFVNKCKNTVNSP